MLGPIQLVFILLAAAVALTWVARRLQVAEPILLLVGGIALSRIPDLPEIELAPDVVFLLFLPPILFAAAYFTPIRDFRANLRPILLLAIGLVLFTTAAVAIVVQALTGIPIAAAVALGAIVAPPDAVAATAVFRRLGVPRRVVTILEGESLINDASALIAYRAAVAAAGPVAFSLGGAGLEFVIVGAGGLVVGVVIGTDRHAGHPSDGRSDARDHRLPARTRSRRTSPPRRSACRASSRRSWPVSSRAVARRGSSRRTPG